MYKVGISGKELDVEAAGMTVESVTLIFFDDDKNEASRMIVASGKCDYLKVDGDSTPLSIRPRTPAPIEEPVAEAVPAPSDEA